MKDTTVRNKVVTFTVAGIAVTTLIASGCGQWLGNSPQFTGLRLFEGFALYAPFQFEFWYDALPQAKWLPLMIARYASILAIVFAAFRCGAEIRQWRANQIDDFGSRRWQDKERLRKKGIV
jgi:hypothetical protein